MPSAGGAGAVAAVPHLDFADLARREGLVEHAAVARHVRLVALAVEDLQLEEAEQRAMQVQRVRRQVGAQQRAHGAAAPAQVAVRAGRAPRRGALRPLGARALSAPQHLHVLHLRRELDFSRAYTRTKFLLRLKNTTLDDNYSIVGIGTEIKGSDSNSALIPTQKSV